MKKLNINVNGNKKLRNTENVRFMIWNLPAVKTCPYRTALCEKSCYARKAERVYPQVLPSREKNFQDSMESDFVENMIFSIEKELNSKKFNGKTAVFRIHESGDFYSLEYAQKWLAIAEHFENDNRIVFLAYTKSIWYFVNLGYGDPEFPKNLVVRSSLWADTLPKWENLTRMLQIPVYTALSRHDMTEKVNRGETFTECRCEDCGTCGKCWNVSDREIICEIH